MPHPYKQLSIHRETPEFWRVTFDHPPINLVDFDTLHELHCLVSDLEASQQVKVVVFDSADADFYLAHWDVTSKSRSTEADSPAPSWIDISLRLAHTPAVSIALIRGRARGIGNEIALGFDLRFASIERAILGQPEVGVGLVPGGGGMQRLSLQVGRARALEIVLGADDFDARTAESYGWINRALPDAEIGAFVTRLAQRLSSFDKQALAEAKRILNHDALPSADELGAAQKLFREASSWSGTRVRAKKLTALGLGTRGDLELNFGERVGTLT